MLSRIGIAALLVGLPVLTVAGWGQLAPSPDASPVSNAPAPPPDETPVATFKQTVNLVDLFFTVKDNKGNLVPHLNQQNCSVLEDKAPQKLKSFVAETNQPLTLGILLDTSGSQQRVLPLEQQAGSQFLEAGPAQTGRGLSALVRRECGPVAGLHQQPAAAGARHGQGGDQHRRRQRSEAFPVLAAGRSRLWRSQGHAAYTTPSTRLRTTSSTRRRAARP